MAVLDNIGNTLATVFYGKPTSTILKEEASRNTFQKGILNSLKAKYYPSKYISKTFNAWSMADGYANGGDASSQSAASLLSALSEGCGDKASLIQKFEDIRNFDYVETILRDVATDVLAKSYDQSQGEFFTFHIKTDRYKKLEPLVNKDLKTLKLYNILHDIIEDYLLYGQYILKVDYRHNELDDGVEQPNCIPAYSKSALCKVFLTNTDGFNITGQIEDPEEYLCLNLFSSHKRLEVQSESGSFYYLKMPRGIIPESIIAKINNLRILEALQPLMEIQSIDKKMYFYIRFPVGKDMTEAYIEARDYEKMVKSLLTFSTDEEVTVESIVEKISQVKVVPLFGDQETIEPKEIDTTERIDLQQIEDLRDSISNALKININDSNGDNIEYFKLIKRVRACLKCSIEEWLLFYINKRYGSQITHPIQSDDFEIKLPDVQGVDELDEIDYLNMYNDTFAKSIDALVQAIDSVGKLGASPLIDMKEVVNLYSTKFQKLFGSRVFKEYGSLTEEQQKLLTSFEDGSDSGSDFGGFSGGSDFGDFDSDTDDFGSEDTDDFADTSDTTGSFVDQPSDISTDSSGGVEFGDLS